MGTWVGWRAVLAVCVALACTGVHADPPGHAKAHGWRKKHDPAYAGYQGKRWQQDYGIVSMGRCDTDAVLAVAGAAIGGVVGAQMSRDADDVGRAIAVIAGSAVGAVIGSRVGRQIDQTDQACIGHALELGATGQAVRWDREQVHYVLTPLRDLDDGCRRFELRASRDGRHESVTRVACHVSEGRWQLRP